MEKTYAPKYLNKEVPKTWDEQDAEVLEIVKSNPNRKVAANKMTIVVDDDHMYITYPDTARSAATAAVCTVMAALLTVVNVAVALAFPAIGSRLLSFVTMGLCALDLIINMKGAKKNER